MDVNRCDNWSTNMILYNNTFSHKYAWQKITNYRRLRTVKLVLCYCSNANLVGIKPDVNIDLSILNWDEFELTLLHLTHCDLIKMGGILYTIVLNAFFYPKICWLPSKFLSGFVPSVEFMLQYCHAKLVLEICISKWTYTLANIPHISL